MLLDFASPKAPRDIAALSGQRWSWQQWMGRTSGLALVLLAVGFANSELLRQQDVTPPITVQSGIALAVLLCWGWRAVPGAFLGFSAICWAIMAENHSQSFINVTFVGLGGTLQAVLGNWLVGRFVRTPLLLTGARETLLFFGLTAGVSTMIHPTVMVGFFYGLLAFPDTEQMPGIWLDVWISNIAGIIVGTPIVLTLMARPRNVWAQRRLSVALPLLLVAGLLALATGAITAWDKQRSFSNFEREAEVAAKAIEGALHEPLAVLAATRGLLTVQPEIGRSAFAAATQHFFPEGDSIDFVGQARLVARDPAALAVFEAAARADGLAGFAVRDSQQAVDSPPPAGEAMMVIRNVEPAARVAGEAGLNIRSARAARVALDRAELSGVPVATEGFLQDADLGNIKNLHVAVLQALYKDGAFSATAHRGAMNGAVFVVLKPEALTHRVLASLSERLKPCLTDTDTKAAYRHLAGEPGCEQPSLVAPQLIRDLDLAGRVWSLRLYPADTTPIHAAGVSLAFSLLGSLSMGLLAVLLLTISGRARTVESLAEQRSVELAWTSLALRKKEQRLQSIFDNAPVGIFISALDGQPLEANPQLYRMLGCAAGELAEFYGPYAAEDAALAHDITRGLGAAQQRRVYVRRDGSRLQALMLASLLSDAEGRPEHLLCVVQDLSDQLQLVEHARAREAAEASNRTKTEFLSHMSHELRTPLNGLLGFTQLLQLDSGRSLSEQQKDWIAKIGQAGWHLLAMINDVLDLSRIETGNLKVVLERQDVHLLIDDVKALLTPAAQRRGITVRMRLSALARYAVGDVTRTREVVSNLLSNAIKYNAEGGQVLISAQLVGASHVDIAVTDTGPGLSSSQLASLFQPFNRLGQERGQIEGTGIGLVISRRLAELMNGSLRVGSELGKGTTFTLRLPAADGEANAFKPATPAFASAAWLERRRLAYIEDNAVNIEVMRAVIAQRPLADLAVYEDGATGLAAMLADPPDLLLLDMQLPDTDGLSLLRELRAAPQCAAVIVIMVSADAMDEQIRLSLEAGARHYLTKPFNIRELLSLLDELLDGRAPG